MKKLYESLEWKSLNKIDRAQLLLVIEGLKRGTIISGDFTRVAEIILAQGLEYTLNTPPYCLNVLSQKSSTFRCWMNGVIFF